MTYEQWVLGIDIRRGNLLESFRSITYEDLLGYFSSLATLLYQTNELIGDLLYETGLYDSHYNDRVAIYNGINQFMYQAEQLNNDWWELWEWLKEIPSATGYSWEQWTEDLADPVLNME